MVREPQTDLATLHLSPATNRVISRWSWPFVAARPGKVNPLFHLPRPFMIRLFSPRHHPLLVPCLAWGGYVGTSSTPPPPQTTQDLPEIASLEVGSGQGGDGVSPEPYEKRGALPSCHGGGAWQERLVTTGSNF